jgi:hypothetical protein
MLKKNNSGPDLRAGVALVAACVALVLLTGAPAVSEEAAAQCPEGPHDCAATMGQEAAALCIAGPHHSFLGGPWELVVTMGMEGQGLHFPISVSDEDKPEELNNVFPVMGTPVTVKLQHYVPDLTWETRAVEHANGGVVVKLVIEGDGLHQVMWLSSTQPDRQSLSASVGAVTIRRLYNGETAEELVREQSHDGTVGVVSVWPEGTDSPLEFAARPGLRIALPESKYVLSIIDYVPDYAIDMKTKEVTSKSDKPVNPAIKVSLSAGDEAHEQWLWSKFPDFAHEGMKLPLRMRFTDFDIGREGGVYILAAAGSEAWLVSSKDGKKRVEKAVLNQPYRFRDEAYSFSLEEIVDKAVISTEWKNNSETLLHPALVARIENDDAAEQAVLEFNKPYHHKTEFGTMVLLFRRRTPVEDTH